MGAINDGVQPSLSNPVFLWCTRRDELLLTELLLPDAVSVAHLPERRTVELGSIASLNILHQIQPPVVLGDNPQKLG